MDDADKGGQDEEPELEEKRSGRMIWGAACRGRKSSRSESASSSDGGRMSESRGSESGLASVGV